MLIWQKSRPLVQSLNYIISVTRLFIMAWNLMCVSYTTCDWRSLFSSYVYTIGQRKDITHKYLLYSSSWLHFIYVSFFFHFNFFFLTFFPIESHMRAYGIGRISHSAVSSTDIVVHCCERNGHIHTSVETVWDDFYAEIYQSISCAIFDFTFIIENRWPN